MEKIFLPDIKTVEVILSPLGCIKSASKTCLEIDLIEG